ncbi:hypothetical protein WN51_11774 [Melipona quadrifasciata]|uniref:Uncharacterized protein n=1 Tax=Melipona quadrifasciata TaxID=166423 RepID=A0A0N0BHQ3_9HYME|nr:hypothetical protein WN51_11774 [Melipona quadrifasciata]
MSGKLIGTLDAFHVLCYRAGLPVVVQSCFGGWRGSFVAVNESLIVGFDDSVLSEHCYHGPFIANNIHCQVPRVPSNISVTVPTIVHSKHQHLKDSIAVKRKLKANASAQKCQALCAAVCRVCPISHSLDRIGNRCATIADTRWLGQIACTVIPPDVKSHRKSSVVADERFENSTTRIIPKPRSQSVKIPGRKLGEPIVQAETLSANIFA